MTTSSLALKSAVTFFKSGNILTSRAIRSPPRVNLTVPPCDCFHSHSARRHEVHARSTRAVNPVFVAPSDASLREAFDTPTFGASSSASTSTGLFKQPALTSPDSLVEMARRTARRAQILVTHICRPVPNPDSLELAERQFLRMTKDLDRLSDMLCGVIDLSEFVRSVHPDRKWSDGANQAYEELCAYMNVLNTHVGLYKALKSIYTKLPPTTSGKSPELFSACAVAVLFIRDFEKSGIHLPSDQRTQFVDLSSRIIQLGRKFGQNASEPKNGVAVSIKEVSECMGSAFAERVAASASANGGLVDPSEWEGRVLARQHSSQHIREAFYIAANSSPESHVQTLEELLKTRAKLARLVGRESWGDVALEDKMARSPKNVMSFLDSLNQHNRPLAEKDLQVLQVAKADIMRSHTPKNMRINGWDREFLVDYTGAGRSPLPDISPFLSVGNCFQGLSRLFSSLYGIRFEIEEALPGEVWEKQVRKLKVTDEDEGRIGTIYCDLFAREGKPAGAAHYTVRCSRRVDDDDLERDFGVSGQPEIDGIRIDRNELECLKVEPVSWKGRKGLFQEPIVVLVCGFGTDEVGGQQNGPFFLHWHEVETLFHEMGHAIHSMIGRTDYQNVSGTRCATDFVELPSVLMEHFITSPSVLSLFAVHHKTGRTIPASVMDDLIVERKRFSALETSSQIMMAALDQQYHSSLPLGESSTFNSTEILRKAHEDYNVIPHLQGTHWQTQFGHLFGYGATYYSYLFDRAIAARVFSLRFAQNPLSREAGESFKKGVLRWGGGKEPWEMIGEVVQSEEVARGGEAAMKEVGQWGIEEAARGN